ncbi:hypothetical protein [Bacillus mycoides]|uniref:hypothetical protein n=1 Tax=Bacillus mycoides TaxID=1405 RepID=UPI0011AAFC40|nr:hypothetical protein [Bacillus mycoides]
MTTKERKPNGFWTHKETGKHIVIYHATKEDKALARQVDEDTKTVNKLRLRMWVDELKEEYVKGMR